MLSPKFDTPGHMDKGYSAIPDLLTTCYDPTTGKPAGDDLVEGKRTVLVALALDGADEDDAALLDRGPGPPPRRRPGRAAALDHLRLRRPGAGRGGHHRADPARHRLPRPQRPGPRGLRGPHHARGRGHPARRLTASRRQFRASR